MWFSLIVLLDRFGVWLGVSKGRIVCVGRCGVVVCVCDRERKGERDREK